MNCTNSSFILYNNQCYIDCPILTYFFNNTCNTCLQTCLTCISTASNCTSCITPYNLYERTCVISCPSNTFSSNYTCIPCSTNCLACTDLNTCITCAAGFYLVNGTCRSVCPAGYYVDSSSNRCLQCILPCLTCFSRTNCSSCQSPALLSNNQCISNCTIGSYWNVNLSACSNCSMTNCAYCTILTCISCQNSSYSYYVNGAILNCIYTCIDGTFADNTTMNCSSCYNNCRTCRNSSFCTRCSANYYLLSVASSSRVNECVDSCPLGYYADANTSTCKPCNSNCKQCSN